MKRKTIAIRTGFTSLSNKLCNYRSGGERTVKGATDCRGEKRQGQSHRNRQVKRSSKSSTNFCAYTPLTVDEQGRLIQDGTIIEDSNLVDKIAHKVKKKKGQKLPIVWELFSTAKKRASAEKRRLSPSRGERSKVK